MSDVNRLDAVFEWKMTNQEAEAFKLCLIWEDETKKAFPQMKLARIPLKGDPRKSDLFRHCWKLARETRGLLKPEEYKLYIKGNLQIIRAHNGRIEPNAICGEKAWIRWKVWQRLFNKKQAEVKGEELPVDIAISPKIVSGLDRTKHFLFEKFDGAPTLEKVKEAITKNKMKLWLGMAKISHYYLVLSPWVAQVCDIKKLEEKYVFDSTVYLNNLDDKVKQFFKKEFAHEYQGQV